MNAPAREQLPQIEREGMVEPEEDEHERQLQYLQALVEEKQIPVYAFNEQDASPQNIYMTQSMEHSDHRGIILLTASPADQ